MILSELMTKTPNPPFTTHDIGTIRSAADELDIADCWIDSIGREEAKNTAILLAHCASVLPFVRDQLQKLRDLVYRDEVDLAGVNAELVRILFQIERLP